jgi:hypothetical protein
MSKIENRKSNRQICIQNMQEFFMCCVLDKIISENFIEFFNYLPKYE